MHIMNLTDERVNAHQQADGVYDTMHQFVRALLVLTKIPSKSIMTNKVSNLVQLAKNERTKQAEAACDHMLCSEDYSCDDYHESYFGFGVMVDENHRLTPELKAALEDADIEVFSTNVVGA